MAAGWANREGVPFLSPANSLQGFDCRRGAPPWRQELAAEVRFFESSTFGAFKIRFKGTTLARRRLAQGGGREPCEGVRVRVPVELRS
jgi:hypothetical protein